MNPTNQHPHHVPFPHHHHHLYNSQPYPTQYPYSFGYNHPHHLPDDIHRGSSFFSYSPDVIKHRKRTSRSQRKILEEAFKNNPKPSQYTRKLLIHQTGMERRAIQVWFQNRRAKEKKLAAKALQVNGGSTVPVNDADDSDDDDEKDDEALEVPTSPSAGSTETGKPHGTAGAHPSTVEKDSATAVLPEMASVCVPSPQEHSDASSTPAATTASSSAPASSPRPSSGRTGSPPTPQTAWRSHDSTPALRTKQPLTPDATYSMRRESAPAPLGIDYGRTAQFPTSYTAFNGAMLTNGISDGVAVWESGTPPSPLSSTDDIVSLRRGSLPTFGSHFPMDDQSPSLDDEFRSCGLPAVPSDPVVRRMSLERSRQRLASHPYANQVMANNRSYIASRGSVPADLTHPAGRYNHAMRPPLPHAITAPPSTNQVTDTSDITPHSHSNWDSNLIPATQTDTFPTYVRPRRHGSYHSGMYTDPNQVPAGHRTYTEIVPGPLPAPNFSFGTAPIAPISENENGEDMDSGTASSLSFEDMHRGSFASVTSTESSLTSAWYSDAHGNSFVHGAEMNAPASWQPDIRRASCPAPFVYAFSGLQLNHEAHSLSPDSTITITHDVPEKMPLGHQIDDSVSLEDLNITAQDNELQHKVPALYSDNGSYYTAEGATHPNSGYSEEFQYQDVSNYSDGLDVASANVTSSGPTYAYFPQ